MKIKIKKAARSCHSEDAVILSLLFFERGADCSFLYPVHTCRLIPIAPSPRNETCSNQHRNSRLHASARQKVRCVACYSEDGAWIRSNLSIGSSSFFLLEGDGPRRQNPESWKWWRPRWRRYTKHAMIHLNITHMTHCTCTYCTHCGRRTWLLQ